MQSFQERFKAKSSTMGRLGDVSVNVNRAIVKANPSQLHSPVIQSSGRSIIESQQSISYEQQSKITPMSASFEHKVTLPRRQGSQIPQLSFLIGEDENSVRKYRKSECQSYGNNEYSHTKPEKYYQLGGLGSATVGTDEWIRKKTICEKRKEYADDLVKKKCFTDYAIVAIEKINNRSVSHARNFSAFN